MKVKREYGPQGQLIECNVPPSVPGDLSIELNLPLVDGIKGNYGEFKLFHFMSRYIAGKRALREARKVSRKQLALVSSHVGFLDPESYDLNQQLLRFSSAVQLFNLNSELTMDRVIEVNNVIAKERPTQEGIRTVQNWIGAKTPFDAAYICPPPDLIDELLDNWLNFVNDPTISIHSRAIIGHCQLVAVHPFLEGNGRTARAYMESLLRQQLGDRVPLSLFRLSKHCSKQLYFEMQSLFNVGEPSATNHIFWQQAAYWTNQLQQKCEVILEQTRKAISGKIGLSMFSQPAQRLLNHLWQQPIVTDATVLKMFNFDAVAVKSALTDLSGVGLIEQRRLRQPENAVIWDCPVIFDAFRALDQAVFE